MAGMAVAMLERVPEVVVGKAVAAMGVEERAEAGLVKVAMADWWAKLVASSGKHSKVSAVVCWEAVGMEAVVLVVEDGEVEAREEAGQVVGVMESEEGLREVEVESEA